MDFVGRKAELSFLEQRYQSPRAELVVLYGRRRVGKTETLRQFSQGKPCVFYSCTQETDAAVLAGFSRRLLAHNAQASKFISTYTTWGAAFESIPSLDMDGKRLVIIDEFPYACATNKALPSILQNVWDATLQHENVMVVLCGSSMSFIEDELLGSKNPLYGRATGIWKMRPMDYNEASLFFPGYSALQKLEAYGMLGGIPHYLRQFSPSASIEENVRHAILSRGSVLYNEVDYLMRQELRETAVYNTILGAVASGETALNGIAQKSMVDARAVSTYLARLCELGIVERELSVDAGTQERAKPHRGLWRLTDNYFRFWYAVVRPSISELDAGDGDGVWKYVVCPQLNNLLSGPFEDVCRQWVRRHNVAGELPFRYEKLGRWWKGPDEIDVVALGKDGSHLLGECKYKNTPVGPSVLASLREKERRHFARGDGWLWLFSKSGFVPGGWAEADNVRLVGADELER